jgi:hypothetical protein
MYDPDHGPDALPERVDGRLCPTCGAEAVGWWTYPDPLRGHPAEARCGSCGDEWPLGAYLEDAGADPVDLWTLAGG